MGNDLLNLNYEIDMHVHLNEIGEAITNLKNNIALGKEEKINEQIKSTKTTFLPVYYKLWNLTMSEGVYSRKL